MGSPVNKRPDPWAPSSRAPDGKGLVDAGAVDVEGWDPSSAVHLSDNILIVIHEPGARSIDHLGDPPPVHEKFKRKVGT